MHHAENARVYHAIADPTRREILDLLAASERSVKELTAEFAVSQPAISQHLRELKAARLVAVRQVGREHHYRLTAAPLRPVMTWLDGFRRLADSQGHQWALGPARRKGAE